MELSSKNTQILIKNLDESYSDLILSWRNDHQTIQNSISQRAVTEDEHRIWIESRLENHLPSYVGLNSENEPVGFVFYTPISRDTYEVSINISPNFRGLGIGLRLLDLSIMQANLTDKNLIARILSENEKSQKIFAKLGFVEIKSRIDGVKYFRRGA